MPIERKLAAIMFTDIAGYTALSAKDSTKASELLKTQRDTLKPIVEKHGGSWMKEMGDGLLLTFDSATSSVECSIAIQVATKDIEDLNLRIGIHEGEVIKQDGDVIGDDVNVASRIEPFSAIGGVAISQKIEQAISSNQEFETKYVGKPKLKGVAQEVKVYCITSHGLPETDVSKVSAKLEEESKFNIFALTGGILTAIGIAFWIAVGVFDVSFGGKAEVPSVGILMMDNLGEEDEEFWSSGMTADLITKVAGAGLIRVAPLKDIRNIDSNLSIEEKAKKLRVKYILTHSFLIKDDGFDLWCKLENTENGVALFSNKISEPMSMTTQMVGKLANDIVTSLKVETKQDVMKALTANAGAYELYLKAKFKWDKRQSLEDKEIVRGLLKKSIELDEKLLAAKILLGRTYVFKIPYHRVLNEPVDYDKAREIFNNVVIEAQNIGDKMWEGRAYRNIGVVAYQINYKVNADTLLKYNNKALDISEDIGDKLGMARALTNIGSFYIHNYIDYDSAIDYLYQGLEINKLIDRKQEIARNLRIISYAYREKGEFENFLKYEFLCIETLEQIQDTQEIAYQYRSIGIEYGNRGNYDKAIEFLLRTLHLRQEEDNKYLVGWSHFDLGIQYYYMGELNKALELFEKSFAIFNEQDAKDGLDNVLGVIGMVYFNQGAINDAINYLEKSFIIQEENGFEDIELRVREKYLLLESSIHLALSKKQLGKKYNLGYKYNAKKLYTFIEEDKDFLEFDSYYRLYQLLEDTSYLETAYNQVQEKADNLEPDVAAKFLSYPIPKAILEEWEKVK